MVCVGFRAVSSGQVLRAFMASWGQERADLRLLEKGVTKQVTLASQAS